MQINKGYIFNIRVAGEAINFKERSMRKRMQYKSTKDMQFV